MSTAALLQAPAQSAEPAEAAEQAAPRVIVPGSPEWHAIRRTGIGGSDVAAVLGVSPWRTAYEVFLDKRGELPPQEESEPMRWGTLLEPVIRQRYADKTGSPVITIPTTFRSEAYPWMIANLDGIRRDNATPRLFEAKTARSGEDWGEPGSDEVPLAYLLQVQHYMTVTPFKLTDIAVLIGGNDFRIYTVEADRELQEMLIEAEAEFWHRVKANDPPPPVDLQDTRRRYGSLSAKGSVTAREEDLLTLERLRETRQLLSELGEAEDEAKARLMKVIGEAGDVLVHPSTAKPLATWKLAKAPQRFDEEAFAREHPELHRKYIQPGTPSRRFLLKG